MNPTRVIEEDVKKGFIALKVERLEDLYWLLSIIEPGDWVTMRTTRRVKREGGRADSGERLPMTLTVEVEKVKLDEYSSRLRLTGVVRIGPEKFGIQGQHHTLNVDVGSTVKIWKKNWRRSHLEIIRRAVESSTKAKAILVSMDDEGATVAELDNYNLSEVMYIRSGLSSKRAERSDREGEERRYFSDLAKTLEDLKGRSGAQVVIVGGPGFMKDKFYKYVQERHSELTKSIRVTTTSNATMSGVVELVKRGEVDKAVKDLDLTKHMKLVDEVFELLAKGSKLVTYGLNEVEQAVNMGAAEKVLVCSSLLFNQETRDRILSILEMAEKTRSEFHIVDSRSEPGEKLESIGGIAAILRYSLEL